MAKMIQIRNVPDSIHKTLRIRASRAGTSLSDYLLAEVRRLTERPTLEEVLERIGHRSRVTPSEPVEAVIREARTGR